MIEAMIYGAATGLVLQFIFNLAVMLGSLIGVLSVTLVWAEFTAITIYFAVAGAAGGLLYFRITGQLIFGA